MQFSLTNTGITILFVKGFTHGDGYSLLMEESNSFCGHRRLWSDCADAQADLSFCWAHMSAVTFSHVGALIQVENKLVYSIYMANCEADLGGSVGCAVRLETRRSRVQPPPRSATFFRGDWSWNIFYYHSLPSADSRRAVVSFWRKNVHNTN